MLYPDLSGEGEGWRKRSSCVWSNNGKDRRDLPTDALARDQMVFVSTCACLMRWRWRGTYTSDSRGVDSCEFYGKMKRQGVRVTGFDRPAGVIPRWPRQEEGKTRSIIVLRGRHSLEWLVSSRASVVGVIHGQLLSRENNENNTTTA